MATKTKKTDLVNPITHEKCFSLEEYADSLGNSYREFLMQKGKLAEEEAKILEAIEKLVGRPEVKHGTLSIFGKLLIIKVIRRFNAKYDKNKGMPHPLIAMSEKFPILKHMIRIDVAEKGSYIEQMMNSFNTNVEELSSVERDLCVELKKIRTSTPGKSGINVVERVN